MKARVAPILLLALLSFSSALADTAKGDVDKDPFWHRFILFAGGDVGYNHVSTDAAGELDKDGYQLDVKGFLSYSWRDVTVEGGGGWLYNRSEGSASSGAVLEDNLTTKAGFMHLAGRYRFTPRWELGLLNHILMGADTRFQTTLPQSDHVNWLMGPEAVYRFPLRFPLQLSASFLTDLTISDRQVYQLLFGVQVGFPIFTFPKKKAVETAAAPAPAPVVVTEPMICPEPPPAPTPVPLPTRTYVFDLQMIQFDTAKATIRPASMPMLTELGGFLAAHPDAWGALTIEGHADRRGGAAYNQRLSEQRAESVRQVLLREGVKESAVHAAGYGFSRPLVEGKTPADLQKNRRVEFKIEGITKPEVMDDFFRALNQKY